MTGDIFYYGLGSPVMVSGIIWKGEARCVISCHPGVRSESGEVMWLVKELRSGGTDSMLWVGESRVRPMEESDFPVYVPGANE